MSRFSSSLLKMLEAKGFIKDSTNLDSLDYRISRGEKVAVYCGFDPTAASLHVGHLVSLTLLRHFARAGHTIVPVIGTATGMVGDPSGRQTARPIMQKETMMQNADRLKAILAKELGGENVCFRSNDDWIGNQSLLGFLRDIGAHIPISRILALETVRSRLQSEEAGPSFLEFSYTLLQGFDFYRLNQEFPFLVQIGGSDQWGNICMGLELISKKSTEEITQAWGLTHPLLLNSLGEKMGKTAGKAVWLANDMISAFDFFQFWRTMPDDDFLGIVNLLGEKTQDFRSLDLIAQRIEAEKEEFAFEITSRVRGREAAEQALKASREKGRSADGLEAAEVAASDIEDMRALMVSLGLVSSKSDATRLADNGGVRVNGVKRSGLVLNSDDFIEGKLVISVGKTKHAAVKLVERSFKI